jgi:hypothetical protein
MSLKIKKNESNTFNNNDIPVILTVKTSIIFFISPNFHVLSYDQSFREPKWYGKECVRHVRQ